jgi:hypothetical protein
MPEYLKIVSEEATVYVEATRAGSTPTTGVMKAGVSSPAEAVATIQAEMQSIGSAVRAAGSAFVQAISEMSLRPSSVEVTFALKATADLGFVISKVGGEATFEVIMKWDTNDGNRQA